MNATTATHLDAADMLAVLTGEFGITPETAIHHGGATSDDDGPPERVIAQADLDERAEREYEAWLDRDGRRAS